MHVQRFTLNLYLIDTITILLCNTSYSENPSSIAQQQKLDCRLIFEDAEDHTEIHTEG